MRLWTFSAIAGPISLSTANGALAQAPDEVASGVTAAPHPWQLGFPPALSPIMERIVGLHDLLMWVSTVILVLVLALISYACWRFRASRHPTPSRRTHNTVLEITWTAVPALILIVIAIPSFRLLYFQGVVPDVEMTVKAIGRQWYWSYEYPDHGNFTFDAHMVPEGEERPGEPRLLAADPRVVLPSNTNIRVLVTGADVVHSWAVPALGIKQDAVPGRLSEAWIRLDAPGVYYGQCYELCGVYHPYMPITIEAVTQEQFRVWVEQAQQEYAKTSGDRSHVASIAQQQSRPGGGR